MLHRIKRQKLSGRALGGLERLLHRYGRGGGSTPITPAARSHKGFAEAVNSKRWILRVRKGRFRAMALALKGLETGTGWNAGSRIVARGTRTRVYGVQRHDRPTKHRRETDWGERGFEHRGTNSDKQ